MVENQASDGVVVGADFRSDEDFCHVTLYSAYSAYSPLESRGKG